MLKSLAQDLDVVETALDERDAAWWLRRFNIYKWVQRCPPGSRWPCKKKKKKRRRSKKRSQKQVLQVQPGDNSVKLMWMKHEGLRKKCVFFCLQRVNDLR